MSTPRSMTIFHSPFFDMHHPPSHQQSHPETPQRTTVCLNALRTHSKLTHLKFRQPHRIPKDCPRREKLLQVVKLVHAPTYLDHIQTLCRNSAKKTNDDTYTTTDTYEVALLAASTWLECVDHAVSTGAAFALTRPPGHHALPSIIDKSVSMGFCILNNAGIAARYALSNSNVSNVSIIDFDVHHGNGTEQAINHVRNVRFVSIHQADIYPNTGTDNRGGMYNHILNVSLPAESGYDELLPRLDNEILPFLFEEKPDIVIVSAGFDALEKDDLGALKFQPKDFGEIAKRLVASGGDAHFVFGLEGGYFVDEGGIGDAICECVAGYCFQE